MYLETNDVPLNTKVVKILVFIILPSPLEVSVLHKKKNLKNAFHHREGTKMQHFARNHSKKEKLLNNVPIETPFLKGLH